MATLTFYKFERLIQVDKPQVEVTIQDLLNQIRDYEEMLINLDYGHIANAYGKQPLGGGSYVGITLELINNWRIAFEARDGIEEGGGTILCTISGGNLVAINDYDNNPIYPTAFTQVVIAQSSSPTIIQADTDYAMLYLLESLRGSHKSIGSIYYWDPVNGSDTAAGTTPATAVATFAQAQALSIAASGVNDIVFALATDPSGVTTVEEEVINITSSTPGLKLRGPGYSFQLKPTSAGSDVVTVSGNGVEFSGFYIEPLAGVGNSDNGISVTGDNALIKDVWINNATNNGIDISSTTRTTIETCAIENSTGYGINVGSATSLSNIKKCIITGNVGGIFLSGTTITDNILENNIIYNNSGDGIEIDTGVVRTGIRLHHTISGNTPNLTDNGTGTFQDTSGTITSGDIGDIVEGVWNEIITTGYTTTGSAAKVLKDTKAKATLASLK
jgi:hypothetical protein